MWKAAAIVPFVPACPPLFLLLIHDIISIEKDDPGVGAPVTPQNLVFEEGRRKLLLVT